MNVLQRIIEELSQELNFKYQFLSKDWITMIEKDNKTRYFAGYKFDLNNQGLGTIVDDKYALYDVLSAKNLPTIEYKIVYNENNQNDYAKGCNNLDYVKDYLRKHHEIVLKPNNGTCGHDVIRVSDEQELETIYHRLLTKNFSINMSPFYHIEHEYRVVILNNKVKIIYQKNLPIVIGDGKSTIREL